MTVREILDYNKIIKAILNNGFNIDALIKFKLLGMLKQFESIVENFERIRNEQIEKYGKINSDGFYSISEPHKEDYQETEQYELALKEFEDAKNNFSAAINAILDSETEVEITKFNYKDIMDSEIPTDYLIGIYNLIEE